MGYPRILLAAGASGSGKTLITCGLLQAFVDRGLKTVSFKCGPDYIDPMFHSRVIKTKSRNLDTFFTDEATTRYLFARAAEGADISVIEGVMGYYDGLGGISTRASAYDVARVTETPVLLIINCRGMSLSALAYAKGFREFKQDSRIRGVILNQVSEMMYPEMKRLFEEELGLKVYGYVPVVKELKLESRHLGLVMPDEISGLQENLRTLARILEKSLDMEAILTLAREAEDPEYGDAPVEHLAKPEYGDVPVEHLVKPEQRSRSYAHMDNKDVCNKDMPGKDTFGNDRLGKNMVGKDVASRDISGKVMSGKEMSGNRNTPPVIAVARDEAFCFLYEDNLELLRSMGAELVFFSPLHDRKLPEADGLLLYGGYPELYAETLSANSSMRESIRNAAQNGLPFMAECGGFMYMQEAMEDMEGRSWPMAGVLPGKAFRTSKLGRFGYISLEPLEEQLLGMDVGEIRGHEFHYFDSTCCGASFHAKKPLRKRNWDCIQGGETYIAGFPHLYYYSNPRIARRFLEKCAEYGADRCVSE